MSKQIEENEHIDVSEWLGTPVDQAYAHRMSKPDIVRNNGTYVAENSLTPLDMLYERGVLDDEQHRAAVFVMTLRRVINNSLGVDRIVQEYTRDPAAVERVHLVAPSVILRAALKGMKPFQIQLLHRLTSLPRGEQDRISRPMTAQDLGWLSLCATSTKDTLDLLKKNIDEFFEFVKNANREGATGAS